MILLFMLFLYFPTHAGGSFSCTAPRIQVHVTDDFEMVEAELTDERRNEIWERVQTMSLHALIMHNNNKSASFAHHRANTRAELNYFRECVKERFEHPQLDLEDCKEFSVAVVKIGSSKRQ